LKRNTEKLWQEMADMTLERCRKRCHDLGSCCSDFYCKMVANLLRGIETQRRFLFTKPKKTMASILGEMQRPFIHNNLMYNKFFVDFLVGNTIIEVFGDYWHGNPKFFPVPSMTLPSKKKDKSRIAYLSKCGHNVVVFWEDEIKNCPEVVAAVTGAVLEIKNEPHQ